VKNKSSVFVVAHDCHPQTIEVIQTRAAPLGIVVQVGVLAELMEAGDYFAVLAQYPGSTGTVHDLCALADKAHTDNAAFCVAADLLAMCLLAPPGEWGADIVVGTTQRRSISRADHIVGRRKHWYPYIDTPDFPRPFERGIVPTPPVRWNYSDTTLLEIPSSVLELLKPELLADCPEACPQRRQFLLNRLIAPKLAE
jgi:hypothetical protein